LGQLNDARSPETPYLRHRLASPPTRRASVLLGLLALAVIATAAVFIVRQRSETGPAGALSAVPHDAWLVAFVDVASIRSSPIVKPLLGAGTAGAIPGIRSLPDTCGFDPVAKLRELVVAIPEEGEGDRGDFGIAFTGDFGKDELTACADKAIRARHGEPKTGSRGNFTLVEDTSSAGRARVAYRDGGPFLVGSGAWLDKMMDAADGKAERERPEHAALRAALAARTAAPPRISMTALLPKGLRERLKAEISSQSGDAEKAEGERAYTSVLGVDQAAASVATGGPGSTTQVAVELHCEAKADCDEVREIALRKRLALSKNFGVRMIGLGPLLDSLAVEVQRTSLTATAQAPTDDLARAVQRAVDLQAIRQPSAPPSAKPPSPP
jgi:hypothetical protein